MGKDNLSWIPETIKAFMEQFNELLKNDKVLGFLVVIALAHYVSKFANAKVDPGVLEWFKIALGSVAGAVMGYQVGKGK